MMEVFTIVVEPHFLLLQKVAIFREVKQVRIKIILLHLALDETCIVIKFLLAKLCTCEQDLGDSATNARLHRTLGMCVLLKELV